MQVNEIMSSSVKVVSPDDNVIEVARMMKEGDLGSLPVGANDRLQGMITDRDIILRAVAEGKNPEQTKVKDCMSEGVYYCYEDDDIESVSQKMAETKTRRLPVLNREKRLVGIVSIGDLAAAEKTQSYVHQALKQITH